MFLALLYTFFGIITYTANAVLIPTTLPSFGIGMSLHCSFETVLEWLEWFVSSLVKTFMTYIELVKGCPNQSR